MSVINVDDSVAAQVAELQQKLGDDEDAAVILVTILAHWNQVALQYVESERRQGLAAGEASAFLSSLGQTMRTIRDDQAADDAELADLHNKVVDALSRASVSVAATKQAMGEVLKTYAEFNGNVDKLKKGIGALAKASLMGMNPLVGAALGPSLDRLLS